jgi:hypothetical protein
MLDIFYRNPKCTLELQTCIKISAFNAVLVALALSVMITTPAEQNIHKYLVYSEGVIVVCISFIYSTLYFGGVSTSLYEIAKDDTLARYERFYETLNDYDKFAHPAESWNKYKWRSNYLNWRYSLGVCDNIMIPQMNMFEMFLRANAFDTGDVRAVMIIFKTKEAEIVRQNKTRYFKKK